MAQRLPTYDHFLRGLRNYDLPPGADNWCEICYGEFKEPIRLDCGHIYCEDCLFQALADRNNCPKCRRVLFQARPYSEEEGRYDIRDTDNNNGRQRAGLEEGEIDDDEEDDEDDDELDYEEDAVMQAIVAYRLDQVNLNVAPEDVVQILNISGSMVIRMRGSSSRVIRESVTWALRQTRDSDPVWAELQAWEAEAGVQIGDDADGNALRDEVAMLRDLRQRYRTNPGAA